MDGLPTQVTDSETSSVEAVGFSKVFNWCATGEAAREESGGLRPSAEGRTWTAVALGQISRDPIGCCRRHGRQPQDLGPGQLHLQARVPA